MKKTTKISVIKSSIVTTLAIASFSPIAIAIGKQVIDNYQDALLNDLSRQVQTKDWSQFPNINTATKEMFHNTEGLEPLSSVARGQMVTPYGWLGTYRKQVAKNPGGAFNSGQSNDKDYWTNTLALVGWDGSIIWTNDESNIAIYSAKYNFETNTIFVVRTQDPTGAGGLNGNLQASSDDACQITFTIHDATTGKMLFNSYKNGSNRQIWSFKDIFSAQGLTWKSDAFKKDLYYQDMITLKDYVLWFYMPNTLKLNNGSTYPSYNEFKTIIANNKYFRCFLIRKSDIANAIKSQSTGSIALRDFTDDIKNSILSYSDSNIRFFINPLFVPVSNTNEFEIYFASGNNNDSDSNAAVFHIGIYDSSSGISRNSNVSYKGIVTTTNLDINNWSDQYNNACLLHTRNMFNEKIITVPYVYTSKKINTPGKVNLPIFNVTQLSFNNNVTIQQNPTDNTNTKQFDFGKKIYNYYTTNNIANIDPFSINSNNNNNLIWYPWPGAVNSSVSQASQLESYAEQLYSRLISVSPFDNTVIYASRPNAKVSAMGVPDQYLGYNATESNFASFWICNSSSGNVMNIMIPNSTSYGFTIDANLIARNNDSAKTGGIWDVYKNGFWFDVNSLTGQANKLNLYFPSTGTWKNYSPLTADSTVKSSPIGCIQIDATKFISISNLTNSTSTINKTPINSVGYTNFITSRADLNLWFPRTYQNLLQGANTYQSGIVLNDYDVNATSRAVAQTIGNKLTNTGFFGANNKSVELFSIWETGQLSKFAVKRAQIVTNIDTTSQATPTLNVTLKFNLVNTSWSNPFYNDVVGIGKIKTFEYPVTITNSSWQILDSWSTNYRVNSFSQTSNSNYINFSVAEAAGTTTATPGNYNSSFGVHNIGYWTKTGTNWVFTPVTINDWSNNYNSPLRLELSINYNPNGTANSSWISKLEAEGSGKFKKSYPISSSDPNEKIFSQILDEFVKWKAANLMYGSVDNPTNGVYSPGQIVFQAHLKLNPNYNRISETIYTLPNGAQVAYDEAVGVCYIYKDDFSGNRNVYEQTSTKWTSNSQYGFGSSVSSSINNSWLTLPTSSTKNFIAYISSSDTINDILLRDGSTTTDKIFKAKYNDQNNAIILTIDPQYKEWVKTRFSSYNQLMARQTVIQYLTVGANPNTGWQTFDVYDFLNDGSAGTIFDNTNSFIISSSTESKPIPATIEKIRFNLIPYNVNNGTHDSTIVNSSSMTIDANNPSFISDPIPLDQVSLSVDYEWLKDVSLTCLSTSYLNAPSGNNLSKQDIVNALGTYKTNVLNKASSISGLIDVIELVYSLDQQTYSPKEDLYDLLQAKWQNYTDPNLGIVNLYSKDKSNNDNATKIYVKFQVKDEFKDKFNVTEVNFSSGNNIIELTNIKYFINLQPYVNVLQTEKTSVIQGSNPNTITSFTPPKMTGDKGSAFLAGYTYDQIIEVLTKFGINVEYQKSDGTWSPNKIDVNSYDPQLREIKIRFKTDNNYNLVVSVDEQNVFNPNSSEISLQLNVPILINVTEQTKNNLINKNFISGNNWTITIDAAKEQTIITEIKNNGDSQYGSDPNWSQLSNYLEVQYALQDSEPNASTIFYTRQNFIDHLKAQSTTNYESTIWARLNLKIVPGEDAKFILTDEAQKVFKLTNTSQQYNKIKIYVQASTYETEANQIGAIGSTGALTLTYPTEIQKIINDTSQTLGVKVQYSIKQDITYTDPSGTDITTSWVDDEPTSVPVGTANLKIRIVVTDDAKYEYGMGNTGGNPTAHSIDLTQLSQLVDVDSRWFNQVEITKSDNTLLYLKDLTKEVLVNWENQIWEKSQAIQADNSIKNLVMITYTIGDDNTSYTIDQLIAKLQQMITNYSDTSTLGIIKLWGEDSRGIKINATFSKKTESAKVIFVSQPGSTTTNNNLTSWANTYKVQTEIDLSSYVEYVQTQKISIVLGSAGAGSIQSFAMPTMSGTKGSGFLNGYTYDEIEARLEELGINFMYHELNVSNSPTIGGDSWKLKNQINAYDQTNPKLSLGVSFISTYQGEAISRGNIIVKFTSDQLMGNTNYIQTGNLVNPPTLKTDILDKNLCQLSLLAPTLITVDLTKLDQLAFVGNTKSITNANDISTKIATIITETLQPLDDKGISHDDLKLEIRFSLGLKQLESVVSDPATSEDGIWYTFDKLNDILTNSTTNYNTNSVYAKFYIKDNPTIDGIDKYLLSTLATQNINKENLATSSSFNIYINNTQQTQEAWIKDNLKLQGSQDIFTIKNLNSWLNSQVPAGLEVEYNATANATDSSQPDANSWKTSYDAASPIDTNRNYWIRFKVKDAYIFEGALANDSQHSQAFKLDASQIQVALKVSSAWLEKITLTGNLKNLVIEDQLALDEITKANMMPIPNIIQIEYTYNGIEWLTKDAFVTKLEQLSGAKDSTNWIILREDIKARFALNTSINNQQDPKYLLEVDTINIDEDNSNNINKQLITDVLNSTVKGYINLDKLAFYQAANFSITGTDDEAYLNIKQYNELNNLLSPYSSSNLFSILYKNEKNGNYIDTNKVWTPGQDLTNRILLNGTYQDRYFAMQFKVTDTNYDLYQNGILQNGNTYEYATDEADNKKIDIRISVAIVNPLASNEIKIKFLDSFNNAQWYNGEGGFQLVIEKYDSQGQLESFDTFTNFLENWSAITLLQDQKEALELVYYVANDANEEVKQKAMDELSVYDPNSTNKYNVWKTVSDKTTITDLNYQLKVNDYVMLAVRIKEEKLTSDSNPNGYVLKDNNHSPTELNRVYGYKVHTAYIDVDWTSLKVRNVDAAESASYGLDGYAMLDQISLKRSTDTAANNTDDYLNVSLQLNYFTDFYYDTLDQVLVSGDGSRLVKRDSTNVENGGYYKDVDGQEITDKNGDKIPILYQAGQKDNGILAKPIKENSVQRSHLLVETTTNNYALELNSGESNALYSFFKFQDIAIQFVNKKGLSDPNIANVYDYYVDTPDITKEYEVNSQIKFPIQNNNLVRYTFNSEEFISYIKDPNNIANVYENTLDSSKSPTNGQSKLNYMYKVIRQEGQDGSTIELDSIGAIMWQISSDFGSKVMLKTTYTPVNGSAQVITNNDLSSINNLSNGDRFRIEIVSANENDLIFAQQPSPLVFTISGLYEADIDEEYLQYLRVQQGGNFNGEGQFEIFVDNPYSDTDDHISVSTLLQGYKFMVRVWDANKEIKQDWTNDYESISNLSNGDKVEWKLVAPTGAPVEKAYYNTVANMDKHDANNQVYSFSQVAKVGNSITTIIENSIGLNPIGDIYPEDSGLLISGLPDRISDSYTSITEEEFIRLMNIMNFGYTGINGQGNMISDRDINSIIVNTSGITREQYTMKYLIDQGYVTFYSNDVEFNWNQSKDNSGNYLISPGTLSNGDQITVKYQDPTMSSSYIWEGPEVSGLKERSDSMSLLAYVGIGIASFATLGIFSAIYFVARNRKLKMRK